MIKKISLAFLALFMSMNLAADDGVHRIAIHLSENSEQRMNLVLNNARNIAAYYQDQAEGFEIKVVAYGPGLHIFREDTSPVKSRVASFLDSFPEVSFAACNNTLTNMLKKKADITLVEGVEMVPSGVIELVKLQEEGWSYVRP